MRSARWHVCGVAGLCFALVGCGAKLHPVKGRVHFSDGSPLTLGRVVVDAGTATTGSWGLIRPDGTFEMGTYGTNDGVPPGTYRVFIQNAVSFPPAGHTGPFTPKPFIQAPFTDPGTSGLTFEVPRQREWDIVVEKP